MQHLKWVLAHLPWWLKSLLGEHMLLTCLPHWKVRCLGVLYIILGMKNGTFEDFFYNFSIQKPVKLWYGDHFLLTYWSCLKAKLWLVAGTVSPNHEAACTTIQFSRYYWKVDLTSVEQTILPARPTGDCNIFRVSNAYKGITLPKLSQFRRPNFLTVTYR